MSTQYSGELDRLEPITRQTAETKAHDFFTYERGILEARRGNSATKLLEDEDNIRLYQGITAGLERGDNAGAINWYTARIADLNSQIAELGQDAVKNRDEMVFQKGQLAEYSRIASALGRPPIKVGPPLAVPVGETGSMPRIRPQIKLGPLKP